MTQETDMVTCQACNGTGRSRYRDNQTCDQCDGWGKVIGPVATSGFPLPQEKRGYVMSANEAPRRLRAVDEIDRLHTLAEKLAERRQPVGVTPSFKIAQVKAVGGAVVHEWEVHVPVCDEYPTAAEAFAAQLEFAGKMAAAYPPPTTNGGAK